MLFWKYDQSCISMRDIVWCQYRGTLISLLTNWDMFRVVVCAQVVHRVVFMIFFLLGESWASENLYDTADWKITCTLNFVQPANKVKGKTCQSRLPTTFVFSYALLKLVVSAYSHQFVCCSNTPLFQLLISRSVFHPFGSLLAWHVAGLH